MAEFKVDIDGDASGLVTEVNKSQKSLNDLSKRLDFFKKRLQDATDTKSIERLNRSIKTTEDRMKSLRGQGIAGVGNDFKALNTDVTSAQNVFVEFNRVIQDAPFGIIGIGNNLQQLAGNFSQLSKQAGGFGAAIKASFASFLSPVNLALLGVSAITTAWTYYSMNTKKAVDETKEFVDTLDSLTASTLKGEQNAQKELGSLERLYKATQNVNLSMKDRKLAVDELQKQYPSYFGNIKDETILLGGAKGAYDRLTQSIIAKAKADAYASTIAKNSEKQLENNIKIQKLEKQASDAQINSNRVKTNISEANIQNAQQALFYTIRNNQESNKLNSLNNELNNLKLQNIKLEGSSLLLEKEITKLTEQQGVAVIDVVEERKKENKVKKETTKIERSSAIDLIALEMEQEKIREKLLQKAQQEQSIYEKIRKLTNPDFLDGITQKHQENLTALKNYYNELRKLKGNDLTPEIDLNFKMNESLGKLLLEQDTAYKLNESSNKALIAENERVMKEMSAGLRRATQEFTKNVTEALFNIRGGFDNLFDNLLNSFQSVFVNQISNKLKKVFENIIKDLNQKQQALAGGLFMAGGIVSGATRGTSSIGQGLGSGLQGAGIGFTLGGPIGAGIGALVGIGVGLLKASKNRKQERLQEEQKKLQEKQLKEQERANALAYGSSIIGQMTNNGIVTGFDRNAFGDVELVTSIDGNQINLVLQRTKNSR